MCFGLSRLLLLALDAAFVQDGGHLDPNARLANKSAHRGPYVSVITNVFLLKTEHEVLWDPSDPLPKGELEVQR